MDPSLVPSFYPSDYVPAPPSIINIDPLHPCSSGSTTYNLPFGSTNEAEDLWRGSSIAALRRKAVEYQASSISQYK